MRSCGARFEPRRPFFGEFSGPSLRGARGKRTSRHGRGTTKRYTHQVGRTRGRDTWANVPVSRPRLSAFGLQRPSGLRVDFLQPSAFEDPRLSGFALQRPSGLRAAGLAGPALASLAPARPARRRKECLIDRPRPFGTRAGFIVPWPGIAGTSLRSACCNPFGGRHGAALTIQGSTTAEPSFSPLRGDGGARGALRVATPPGASFRVRASGTGLDWRHRAERPERPVSCLEAARRLVAGRRAFFLIFHRLK